MGLVLSIDRISPVTEHDDGRGFTSLGVKLLRVIILVSTGFTLIATLAQLYFEYQSDVSQLNQRIEQIRQSHLPALELSIWSLDTELIDTQLTSLQSLPDVYAAYLSTRYGEKFKVGPATEDKNLKRYTIDIRTRDAQPLELGTLVLFSDLDVVYGNVIERGKIILVTLGIRTFFVSLCILLIVHLMLARHLTRLARYLRNLKLEGLEAPFAFKREQPQRRDELDSIEGSLNEMRLKMRQDVESLDRARRELEQSERTYRLAINATRDGLWDWNISAGTVEFSPAWGRILGEQSVEPVMESWKDRLHPEDRQRVLDSLNEHLQGKEAKGTVWQQEHRLRNALGEWVWVLGRGEVVERNPRGQALRMIGTMTDIHARKLIEQAHREAEEKVTLLLNSTAEAIYGIGLDGCCTFVNPACLRMLGYDDAGELVGRNMHELMHHTTSDGRHYPISECQINQAFHHGEGVHVDDEVFWRQDGTSFPVEYWSYPVREAGEITGAVVTFLDITERLHDKQVLEHLATHDSLTGVFNRKRLETCLEEETVRAARYKRELSLIMVDIDHFKAVNDDHGHQAGDQVLKAFAGVIRQSTRQNDCAGRYGGEEFMILLPETSLGDANDFAERLRISVYELSVDIGTAEPIRISASFGVSCFPDPADSCEQLIRQADQAMYRAKRAGRNLVMSATDES